MNINKMQGNPAFLDVCQCSKEPQKCVVLSLSRLKHGFDCSAALQVSPGSHLCSYAPLRSFLARGRPFDAAGDTRPAGEISAPRPSRSEERRVGKEGVSQCRSVGAPKH